MAYVTPFKGILYNKSKVGDLKNIITPPYDVISPDEQKQYHKIHPQNIIRLILGEKTENDDQQNNPHIRAAHYLKKWLEDKILIKDTKDTIYLTSTEFKYKNSIIIRFGFIALVKLETFDKGIVLPHEKTFSKIKSERLELMKVCHANFSQIFSIFADKNNILDILRNETININPDIDCFDSYNHRQRLWKITKSDINKFITDSMSNQTIFIADGHHRYETAINYRDWVAAQTQNFTADHPSNYIMMYLSSMRDEGLVILPAHRILSKMIYKDDLIISLKQYFDIKNFSFTEKNKQKVQYEFLAALELNESNNAIGLYVKNDSNFYLLILKQNILQNLFKNEIPDSLLKLDVTVLTKLILCEIIGLNQSQLDDEKLITYTSDSDKAIKNVSDGWAEMAFILNPTKIEQVKIIAEERLIMPRKSTYFYPKVITGLVLNNLM